MKEPLPLAMIHEAVLEFLRGRDDVVVFGATAVNAYVSEPRMTQDIDLMSTRAPELAHEISEYLDGRFQISMTIRVIGTGKGYRLFQMQEAGRRHLVDVRSVEFLPQSQIFEGVHVIVSPELIARKVISVNARRAAPKAGTDWRDIAMLLLSFPELKTESGTVSTALETLGATAEEMKTWRDIVAQEIIVPNDDDEFN